VLQQVLGRDPGHGIFGKAVPLPTLEPQREFQRVQNLIIGGGAIYSRRAATILP